MLALACDARGLTEKAKDLRTAVIMCTNAENYFNEIQEEVAAWCGKGDKEFTDLG